MPTLIGLVGETWKRLKSYEYLQGMHQLTAVVCHLFLKRFLGISQRSWSFR